MADDQLHSYATTSGEHTPLRAHPVGCYGGIIVVVDALG
jgi:hypothetical protein